MADKQIGDFSGTTTVTNSAVFHVQDNGINKKIATPDLVTQINQRLTYPTSSTSQAGIVQLNNSTTSTSTTQAATANAVRLVNNAVNSLSSSLTVVTNTNDRTAGRITTVGWAGHGGDSLVAPDLSVTNTLLSGGIYSYATVAGTTGGPAEITTGNMIHVRRANGGGEHQTFTVENKNVPDGRGRWIGNTVTRSRTSGTWSPLRWQLCDADLTSSLTDVTPDRIPTVGWMGYGRPIVLTAVDSVLSLPYYGTQTNSKYTWTSSSTAPSGLPFATGGYLDRLVLSSGYETLYATSTYSTPTLWVNTKNNNVWSGWSQIGAGGSGGIPEAPSNGNLYGRRNAAWEVVPAGGSGGADPGLIDLGNVATSGSQTITLNLSQGNKFYASMNTANTTGVLNISFSNIPQSGNVDGYIVLVRAGAKNSPIGLPANSKWAQNVVPQLDSSGNSHAVIQFNKFKYMPGFIFSVVQSEKG